MASQHQLLEAIYAASKLGDQNATQSLKNFQSSPNFWEAIHDLFSLSTSPSPQLPLPIIHHYASLLTLDKVRTEWKGLPHGKEEIKAMLAKHFSVILQSLQAGLYASYLSLSHAILSNLSEALATISVLDHSCEALFDFAVGDLQQLSPSISLILLTSLHDLANSKKLHLGLTTTSHFESFLRNHSSKVFQLCESFLTPLLPLLNKDINPAAFTTLSAALIGITSHDAQPPQHLLSPDYANIEHIKFSPFYTSSSSQIETYSFYPYRSLDVTSPLIPIRTYCQVPTQVPLHSITTSADLLFLYRHTPSLHHSTSLSSQHNFLTLVLKCVYSWLPSTHSISTLLRVGHGSLLHLLLSLLPFDQYSSLTLAIITKALEQRGYPAPSSHKQAVFIVAKVAVEYSLRLQARMLYSWICSSNHASDTSQTFSGSSYQSNYPHSHLILHLKSVATQLNQSPLQHSSVQSTLSQLPNLVTTQPQHINAVSIITSSEQYASVLQSTPQSLPALIYNTYLPYFPQSASTPEDIFEDYINIDTIYKSLRLFIGLCTTLIEKDTTSFILAPNPIISLTNFMLITLCHPQIRFSLSSFEYFTSVHDSLFTERGYVFHQPLFISVFIIIALQLSYPGLALLWLFRNPDQFDSVAPFGSTQFEFEKKSNFPCTTQGSVLFFDEKKRNEYHQRIQRANERKKPEEVLPIIDFLDDPNIGDNNVDLVSRQYLQLINVHPSIYLTQTDPSTFFQTFTTFQSPSLQQLTSQCLAIQYTQHTLLSSFSHISQFQLATMARDDLTTTLLFDINTSVEFADIDCTTFSLFTPSFFTELSEQGLFDGLEQVRQQFVNFVENCLYDIYHVVDISILTFFLRILGCHIPPSNLISQQQSQMQQQITQTIHNNDPAVAQIIHSNTPPLTLLSSSTPDDYRSSIFPSTNIICSDGSLLDTTSILELPTLNIDVANQQQQQQQQQSPPQVSLFEFYSYLEHLPHTITTDQLQVQSQSRGQQNISSYIPYSLPRGFTAHIYITFTQSILKILIALAESIFEGLGDHLMSFDQMLKDDSFLRICTSYQWAALQQHQQQQQQHPNGIAADINFGSRLKQFNQERSLLLQQYQHQVSAQPMSAPSISEDKTGPCTIFPQGYSIDFVLCSYLQRRHSPQLARIHTLTILTYHLINIATILPTIPTFSTPSPLLIGLIQPQDYNKHEANTYNPNIVPYIVPLSAQLTHLFIAFRYVLPLLHQQAVTSVLYLIIQYIAAASQSHVALLSDLIKTITPSSSSPQPLSSTNHTEHFSLAASLLPYLQNYFNANQPQQSQEDDLQHLLTTLIMMYRTPQISTNGLYNMSNIVTKHRVNATRIGHLAPFSSQPSFISTSMNAENQLNHTLQPTHLALFGSLAFSLICDHITRRENIFSVQHIDSIMFTSDPAPLISLIFTTFALRSIGIHVQTPEMSIINAILPLCSAPNHAQILTKYHHQYHHQVTSTSQLLQFQPLPSSSHSSTIHCINVQPFTPLLPYIWTPSQQQLPTSNLSTYLLQLQNSPQHIPFLQHLSNLPQFLESIAQQAIPLSALPSNPYYTSDIQHSQQLLQSQLSICSFPSYLLPCSLQYLFEGFSVTLLQLPTTIAHHITSALFQSYLTSCTSLIQSLEQSISFLSQHQPSSSSHQHATTLLRYFTISFVQPFLSSIVQLLFVQNPVSEIKDQTGLRSISLFYGHFPETPETTTKIAATISSSILPMLQAILTPLHKLISTPTLTSPELKLPLQLLLSPSFTALYPSSSSSSLSLSALQAAHQSTVQQFQSRRTQMQLSTTLSTHFTTPPLYYLLQSLSSAPSPHAVEHSPSVITSYIQCIGHFLQRLVIVAPDSLLPHIPQILTTLTALPFEFNHNTFVETITALHLCHNAADSRVQAFLQQIAAYSARIEFLWSTFAHIIPIITSSISSYGANYATVPFFAQNIEHVLNFIMDSLSLHTFLQELLTTPPPLWFNTHQNAASLQSLPLNHSRYTTSVQTARPLLFEFYNLLNVLFKTKGNPTDVQAITQSLSSFITSNLSSQFPPDFIIKNKLLLFYLFSTFSYYNFLFFATFTTSFLKDFYTLSTITTMHCGGFSEMFPVLKLGLESFTTLHSSFNSMHQHFFFFLLLTLQSFQYDPWYHQCLDFLATQSGAALTPDNITVDHLIANKDALCQFIISSHAVYIPNQDPSADPPSKPSVNFLIDLHVTSLLIRSTINTTHQLHQLPTNTPISVDQYDAQTRLQREPFVNQVMTSLFAFLSSVYSNPIWSTMVYQITSFILHSPLTTLACLNAIKSHLSQQHQQQQQHQSQLHPTALLFQSFLTSDTFFSTLSNELIPFQVHGPLQSQLLTTLLGHNSPELGYLQQFPSISALISLNSQPQVLIPQLNHLLATIFSSISSNHTQDASSQQRLADALSTLTISMPQSPVLNPALEFAFIHAATIPQRFSFADRTLLARFITQLTTALRDVTLTTLWQQYLVPPTPSPSDTHPSVVGLFDPSPNQPRPPTNLRSRLPEPITKQVSSYKSKLAKFERKLKAFLIELTTSINHPTTVSLSNLEDFLDGL